MRIIEPSGFGWPPYVPIKVHFVTARQPHLSNPPTLTMTLSAYSFFYLLFTALLFADSISIRHGNGTPRKAGRHFRSQITLPHVFKAATFLFSIYINSLIHDFRNTVDEKEILI